jgi:hypothetical protein
MSNTQPLLNPLPLSRGISPSFSVCYLPGQAKRRAAAKVYVCLSMVIVDQMTVSFPQLRVCDLPATNEPSMLNSRSDRIRFISKNEGEPLGGRRYSVS